MSYTTSSGANLEKWFKDNGITEVECLVPDVTGIPRGKIMPSTKYLNGGTPRLPESIFIQTVTGDYPEESNSLIDAAEIDVKLVADLDTLRLVPWAEEPTAQLIHDVEYMTGEPVAISPRYVLKRVLGLYEARGWKPVAAPEMEFYLIKKNTDPDYPLEPPIGRSGRQETGRRSYSIDAVNEFDPLFEEMYDYCEVQNLDIDTLIHEEGAAQVEINFLHGDPLKLADEVFLFKRTLREVALRHDIYATFMAKPMTDEPGSAMHIHQSLLDEKTGQNLFIDANGDLSQVFMHFIGGMQRYLPAAMPLMAPNVNSYRRLTPHAAAPLNIYWGFDNRTVGLRVPHDQPQATRIENRLAGADANPYLAMAASLAAGYLGLIQEVEPSPAFRGSAYEEPMMLPTDLSYALLTLSQSAELGEVLGERFLRAYCAVKRAEYNAYFRVVSSWEREHLLLSV